jgi:hypothetical protein
VDRTGNAADSCVDAHIEGLGNRSGRTDGFKAGRRYFATGATFEDGKHSGF